MVTFKNSSQVTAPQQNSSKATTTEDVTTGLPSNIRFDKKNNTICNCKLMGKHSKDCKPVDIDMFKAMTSGMAITQSAVVEEEIEEEEIEESNPTRFGGLATGKPVEEDTTEEYPDGYKYFTEDGIVLFMTQDSISNNGIKYTEVASIDITKSTDWGVLLPKLWLELGSTGENKKIKMIKVTIQAIED